MWTFKNLQEKWIKSKNCLGAKKSPGLNQYFLQHCDTPNLAEAVYEGIAHLLENTKHKFVY